MNFMDVFVHENESKPTFPGKTIKEFIYIDIDFSLFALPFRRTAALNPFEHPEKKKHRGKQERYAQWRDVPLHTRTRMKFIWFRWLVSGGRLIANKKKRKMHFLAVLIYSESASTAARNTKPQMCPYNRMGSRIQAKHKEVIKWDKFGGNDQGDSVHMSMSREHLTGMWTRQM